MLIDRTYFVGDLNIPNSNLPDVGENLDWYIEKYENQFLEKLLGYDLYKAFRNGLVQTTVEQRWNDLVFGSEYSFHGKTVRWNGLKSVGSSISTTFLNLIDVVVGRGGDYDPVAGTNSVAVPPMLIDKPFNIELRGYGLLRPDEYSTAGGIFTWLTPKTFINGETLFYRDFAIYDFSIGPATLQQRSIIANYVYWYWHKNHSTQTTALGETKPKAQHAVAASPALKMVTAWNEMYQEVLSFLRFVQNGSYPEWDQSHAGNVLYHFHKANTFGI